MASLMNCWLFACLEDDQRRVVFDVVVVLACGGKFHGIWRRRRERDKKFIKKDGPPRATKETHTIIIINQISCGHVKNGSHFTIHV